MIRRGTYDVHLSDVTGYMERVNIIVCLCQWLYAEVGLRGSAITAVINGVRYELSCSMIDVAFLEDEIIKKRANKSYQLTLMEAKAVAVVKLSRATIPCPEEVMELMRKCYWDAAVSQWDLFELRLTYLCLEWAHVTGRRPSNFSLNGLKARDDSKGRDHNLLASAVLFETMSGSLVCSTDKCALRQLVRGSVRYLVWSDTTKTTSTSNYGVVERKLDTSITSECQLVYDMLEFACGPGAGAADDKGYFFSIERKKNGKNRGQVLTFVKRSTSNMLATALKACGASVGIPGLTLKSMRVAYATKGEALFRHGGSIDRGVLDRHGNWAAGSTTQVSTYSRVNRLLPEDVTAIAVTGCIRISHLAALLGNKQRTAVLAPSLGKRSASICCESDDVDHTISVVGASACRFGESQRQPAGVDVDSDSEDYGFAATPADVMTHLETYLYHGGGLV
jgi:hypothetical protein